MVISLLGYMGSGKSHVARQLSQRLGLPYIDLDQYLVRQEGRSITEIFKNKGEIYFRAQEHQALKEVLAQGQDQHLVLSVGGGTPVYYNNIDILNQQSVSIFLQVPLPVLVERLGRNRSRRPMIAHLPEDQLEEYIAKHLMERNPYYQQAQYIIACGTRGEEEILEEILTLLSQKH